LSASTHAHRSLDFLDNCSQVHVLGAEFHHPCLHLREVEQVVDQLAQMLSARMDPAGELHAILLAHLDAAFGHHLGKADDRGQGCAKLVRHVGQEVTLSPAGPLGCVGKAQVFSERQEHPGENDEQRCGRESQRNLIQ
jgi:hypothetical protein